MPTHITTGVDIIEIERIERAIMRWNERFLQRIYTPAEVEYCRGRAQSFAGRFAGKEAVSKALGVGIRVLSWRDIEILPDGRGKPTVFLHGKAEKIAGYRQLSGFDISITHSRDNALAFVVGWGAES
ncbi:MAG: holo-ACP synthase [Chloroflexota bacterium]